MKSESKDKYLIEGLNRTGDDNKRSHSVVQRSGEFKRTLVFEPTKVFHSFRKSFIPFN